MAFEDKPIIPFPWDQEEKLTNVSQLDPRYLIDPTMTANTIPPNMPNELGDTVNSVRDGIYYGQSLFGPVVEIIKKDFDSDIYPAKEGYDPLEDDQLVGMDQYLLNFYGSRSPEETRARLYRLNARLDTLAKAGAWGTLGYFTGAVADPLYAGGAVLASTRIAQRILTNARRTGAYYTGVGLASEVARAGLEPGDSEIYDLALGAAFGAAGGTVLGRLNRINNERLAAAATRYRAEMDAVDKGMEDLRNAEFRPVGEEAPPPVKEVVPNQTVYTENQSTIRIDDDGAGGVHAPFDDSAPVDFTISDGKLRVTGEGASPTAFKDLIRYADEHGLEFTSDKGVTPEVQKIYEDMADDGYIVERSEDGAYRATRDPETPRTSEEPEVPEGPVRSGESIFNKSGYTIKVNEQVETDAAGTFTGQITTVDKSASVEFSVFEGGLLVTGTNAIEEFAGTGVPTNMVEDLVNFAKERNLEFRADLSKIDDVDGVQKIYDDLIERGYEVEVKDGGFASIATKVADDPNAEGIPFKSLSSGASDAEKLAPTYEQRLRAEAAVSAFLMEKIPNNPVKRVLLSSSARARDLVSEMMEIPFFQNKHFAGGAAVRSIERALHSNRAIIADLILVTRSHYDKYVMRELGRKLSVTENLGRKNSKVISYAEFRKQITLARMSGNKHDLPEVVDAAKYVGEKIYDPLAQRAADLGIYPDEIMLEMAGIKADLKNGAGLDGLYTMRGARGGSDRVPIEVLEERLVSLENRLKAFQENPNAGTRPNFVNLVFRRDRIRSNRDEVKAILTKSIGMDSDAADDLVDIMSSQRPYQELGPDSTGMASSLRTRELFKNDLDLQAFIQAGGDKFIETDILMLSRYYQRTFGTDLDIFEKFGSIHMKSQLNEIRAEYGSIIKKVMDEGGPDSWKKRAELEKQMDRDLDDVRAMRDLLRGTYGLSADPNSGLSTAIRVFKRANAITMLTGALPAVTDVGRIVMTEGLSKSFAPLYEDLFRGFDSFKLAKADAQMAGEALDMLLSTRAAMMADVGDGIGLSSAFDSISDKMADFTFSYVNFLNPWTDLMKSWTSLVAGNRILLDSIALSSGKLDDLATAKLHRGGIDADMARRIAEQFEKYGQTEGSVNVARLKDWDDPLAKQTYEDALSRDISRAIVTPGLGDPPLWMNTEWGGLLGQFKKFSAGAFERIAVAGLQERNMATLYGMVVMVGLGMMIDKLRADQIGIEDETLSNRIAGGIDRSGVLGWVGDVVNAADTILDPNSSGRQLAGTLAGPTGSQVSNLVDMFYGVTDGNEATPTSQNVRRMLPWQNVFWLDGTFDALTGTK